MRAARLAETADELFVLGLEEDQLDLMAALDERVEHLTRAFEELPVRTSTPTAMRRSSCSSVSRPISSGISAGGMLSTQKNPRSSSKRSAVLRPAPDIPVTTTTCSQPTRERYQTRACLSAYLANGD